MATKLQNSNNLDLDNLVTSSNSNMSLTINIKYFKKCNDYTELIKKIMEHTNKFQYYSTKKNIKEFLNVIIDFTGVKVSCIDYEFLKMLFPFLDEHYPDLIKKINCVNVPQMFKIGYKVIRPFINKDTRKKILILSKGENGPVITGGDDKLGDLFSDDLDD